MYGVNNNIQQQLAQNRMNQLEMQYNQNYNNMFPQQNYMQQNMMQQPQQTQQNLKGRPVSNVEEAKASMIDLDGSLFVFPDVANECIYTKQIMLDGTADFKTYKLVGEQKPKQSEYVLRSEFQEQMQCISAELKRLRGETNAEQFDEAISE